MGAGAWTVAREDWRSRSDYRRAMVSDPSPPLPRSGATGGLYRRFVEPLLRTDEGADAEQLSRISLGILGETALRRDWPVVRDALQGLALELQRRDPRLQQTLFGCRFANPVGLAAGFDKNGVAAALWDRFGFGFAELGTVTWEAQPGNPRPRLFRLAAERAALNRMGFNNEGARAVRRILERQKLPPAGQRPAVLGLNLGKSRLTSLQLAPDDYASSLELLAPLADYAVVNVSSPNTPGLRELQEESQLRRLVERLRRLPACPPLLVKIAPDLEDDAIDAIARLAYEEGLAGVIAVNTSQDRLGLGQRRLAATGRLLEEEAGGLSGRPLRQRALEVLRRLRATAGPALPLVGVGGIDGPQAAWERITAGASLVQIYTGWIYEGPILVPEILEGLVQQLERHGLATLAEAVGSGLPWRSAP
jgi:dihydroorotate dehydrogenase